PPGVLPTNHYPIRIVSVDGDIQFRNPVQLAPGPHSLVLEAAPGDGARGTTQRSFAFKVEPCARYFLAAARSSPVAADWKLVVVSRERVAGCIDEEELKKH
ncbi:MAG: hypothetical protein HY255_13180, partial [Betaproteobacteria bacterium]|nr:hypothetical protein [Betaproteobacteria bacterium]